MARPNRRPNRKKPNHSKPVTEQVKVSAITYTEGTTVFTLSEKLHKGAGEIIKLLFMLGKMVTINSILEDDEIQLICMEYGVEPTKEDIFDEQALADEDDVLSDLIERAPIVTIMGHVDHGKTTLLDTIRKTKVVASEHGGITQHIGAYQIKVNDKLVTFFDTPGHAAFTAMRARGAQVTDICIIVVAADDGVMPQTKEAIDHAQAAKVPIIVAINKIDKPNSNIDKIVSEMSSLGLVTEEWGGDTIFSQVSAKTGEGIDTLLETILLVAEVQELRANPNKMAFGTVVEAKLDKGRGPVATLLVKNGTLHLSDSLVIGHAYGKIRRMCDDTGKEIKIAGPSTPVEIIGLNDVPEAGDSFKAFADDRFARTLASKRASSKIESDRKESSARSLDDLSNQIKEGNIQSIEVIIKADVHGSAEALRSSLERIEVDGVKITVVRTGVGSISENDVMLASASNAIIVGFNIRPDANVRKKAEESGVEIRLHNIIYKVIEELELAMKGMLKPVYQEVIFGQAEIRQLFKVSKIGTIAGCMVTDGKIQKANQLRLIRDGVVVYTGKFASLKRFQNDIKEVAVGYDCGITIENHNDLKIKDIIEAFGDQEIPVS